ncbi:MAG: hypothetical protein ACI97A_000615 [Planctomycetota bacterium]|jgi:hypothetical protein
MSGRVLFLTVLIALSTLTISACKEDDTALFRQSKQLARQFHEAVMIRDIEVMGALAYYPFHFDNSDVIKDRVQFKKVMNKRLSSMQARMKSARSMESVTYNGFVSGHEIRGKKLEGDVAKREAEKLNFEEGDVLVRCFAVDSEKREDGRDYYVVLRKDDLGDLKIHTYFD